ncbi:MAG TPA: KTSC domain-containing protein [Terracidiphilus sp.]|jgi:hypothetical protein
MTVDLKPVSNSSNIQAVGYDPQAKEMHVQFSSGTYVHEGVSPEQHAALMAAPSKGKHYHAHIKGKFKHRKL